MKADEMFIKCGYEKTQDDVNWITYIFYGNEFEIEYKIQFYKPHQDISFYCGNNIFNTIDMDELKAINQKCKELGWLGDE